MDRGTEGPSDPLKRSQPWSDRYSAGDSATGGRYRTDCVHHPDGGAWENPMKSPRRRYFWPPMTPVLSRASSYSLMVAERKSKSFASVACVARGRISAWENGSRAGHWRFDG